MAEWRTRDEQGQPVYDDDRLLALVLGLDEDPELEAAAAGDEDLRRRLAEMRTDVAAVGGQLDALVPGVPESYADPLDPRWSALHEYFAPPRQPKPVRAAWSRWLRVLAPVAAVAVALAIGVGVLTEQRSTVATSTSGGAVGAEKRDLSSPATDSAGFNAQRAANRAEVEASLAGQAERYAVVVVARAAAAVGDAQRFTVVRILKGEAPAQLQLTVLTAPVRTGVLHILFLHPLAGRTPAPAAAAAGPPAASRALPSTSPTSAGQGQTGTRSSLGPSVVLPRAVAFRYEGGKAAVRRLPAGVDATTLHL